MGKSEEVRASDLPEEISGADGLNDCLKALQDRGGYEKLTAAIKDFEKRYIARVLEETKGNKTLAAKVLGVSRKTLWEKCKLLEIIAGE